MPDMPPARASGSHSDPSIGKRRQGRHACPGACNAVAQENARLSWIQELPLAKLSQGKVAVIRQGGRLQTFCKRKRFSGLLNQGMARTSRRAASELSDSQEDRVSLCYVSLTTHLKGASTNEGIKHSKWPAITVPDLYKSLQDFHNMQAPCSARRSCLQFCEQAVPHSLACGKPASS